MNNKPKKMYYFKQYMPAYYSGFDMYEGLYESIEDLMNWEKLKVWSQGPDFHQFSQTFYPDDTKITLMCELDGGSKWWVIGFITVFENGKRVNPPIEFLPIWDQEKASRLKKERKDEQ